MNYRVMWDADAIKHLQQIFDIATDQEAITHAVHRIGTELAANPLQAGESRDRGQRVLFKYPLMIQYRLRSRLQENQIIDVRLLRR